MKPFLKAAAVSALGILALTPLTASAQSSASDYTSATRYDAMGRVVGTIAPDPDGTGGLKHLATRTTYDVRGNVTKVETGELQSWKSEAIAPASWGSAFEVQTIAETTYDAMGRKLTDEVSGKSGSTVTPVSLTQYSYDSIGRLECTAVRMNPAAWNSLPSSACVLGVQGPDGPDRITRTIYDAAGQVLQVRRAVGTNDQISEVTYNYYLNGQIDSVVDANGNRAKYLYDEYDRLRRWHFPNKTRPANYNPLETNIWQAGASTPTWTDFENYTYDANGNRTALRKRDGSIITYEYDALNRMTRKIVPERSGLSLSHTRDIYYAYDLRGLQTKARFEKIAGLGNTYTYDGFGRMTDEYQSSADSISRRIRSAYDANGNRTQIVHPDGNYWRFEYDGLNRVNLIRQHTWRVGLVNYNNRGLMNKMDWFVGSSTQWNNRNYAYDSAGRLDQINVNVTGSSHDVTWDYTRNPASQIRTEIQSNDSYSWDGHVDITRNYTTNGLNQYTGAGSANFTYDANGNLTSDGSKTFLYDVENRLVKVTGGGRTTDLYYDPVGRLFRVEDTQNGRTNFIYDGNALIAEYNGSGTVLRRYVHGSNAEADDPLIWYEGSAVGGTTRRFLYADPRGSIIAVTNSNGNATAINSYDAYGIPDGQSGNDLASKGRFRYTGQAWIPELGMYYYKARMYSPTLGRFLQTDPIGYEDQFNLYGYVHNDPINGTDPSGLCGTKIWGGKANPFCKTTFMGEEKDEGSQDGNTAKDAKETNVRGVIENTVDTVDDATDTPGDSVRWTKDATVCVFTFSCDDTIKVGRWMSDTELDAMRDTGFVQPPLSGAATKHVNIGNDPNAYGKQAKPGSVYVTFHVPKANVVRSSDNNNWAQIPGPDSIYSKKRVRNGEPAYQWPRATRIWRVRRKRR